ncbi:hypothetical protein B0H19DRAFT_542111 [Mycena capillaripes]|nr:hypothetical protein B0H19DRAFT_542111 [Mycena capillaripes]
MPPAPEPGERLSGNESSRPPCVAPRPARHFLRRLRTHNLGEYPGNRLRPAQARDGSDPARDPLVFPSFYVQGGSDDTLERLWCARARRGVLAALLAAVESVTNFESATVLVRGRGKCGSDGGTAGKNVLPTNAVGGTGSAGRQRNGRVWVCNERRGVCTMWQPLGAVQTYCFAYFFRGSTVPPMGCTYIFVPSAITPMPSSILKPQSQIPVCLHQAVAQSSLRRPPTMPLPPAPSAVTHFSSDFIQTVANGLDEFVDIGLFRGDGDLKFERDFGQWFNPDDVGMPIGEQTTPRIPNASPTSVRFFSS